MITKHSALVLVPLAALVFGGCGHTNNLAHYNVAGARYQFRSVVAGGAASVQTHVAAPDTTLAAGILTAIGESIAGGVLEAKIARVPPGMLADAVSDGLHDALTDYLRAIEAATAQDNPAFLVETTLKKYAIRSSAHGADADVEASCRIVDRATGGIVWENCETVTVSLGGVSLYARHRRTPAVSGAGIFNATLMLGMSDDQLRSVLAYAAEDVGHAMGETLRKDVADLPRK